MALRQRPNWRQWVGTQMNRVARALEFFAIGILRPEDFIAFSQRHYETPTQVAILIHHSTDGLYPLEASVLERVAPKAGSALVLGCGGGREAIALAKQSWEVVGIDNAPAAIEAAKANAAQAGVQIEFHCYDITQEIPLDRSFDLICMFGLVYSTIPTRKRRVRLLTSCRKSLKPNGPCLFDFISGNPPSQRQVWAQVWRKGLAYLVRGNPGCQLGDIWSNGALFVHRFCTLSEIAEEAAEAGLRLEGASDLPKEMVILRPLGATPHATAPHATAPHATAPHATAPHAPTQTA